MPKIRAATTSHPDTRVVKHPPDRVRRTTSEAHANRTDKALRIVDHIARTDNAATTLSTQKGGSAQNQTGRSMTSPPHPEVVQWFTHFTTVPEQVRSEHSACIAHMRSVLYSCAIVASDYWHESLGGRPLSVLSNNGQDICRIRPETGHGQSDVQNPDAVIKITDTGPKPYDTATGSTRWNNFATNPLCSAAVRAALFHLIPLTEESLPAHNKLMAHHEVELGASMEKWADSNIDVLKKMAFQMMGIESVEVDDRKELTHASNDLSLPSVGFDRTMLSASRSSAAKSSATCRSRRQIGHQRAT